jgi:hypothetical protein
LPSAGREPVMNRTCHATGFNGHSLEGLNPPVDRSAPAFASQESTPHARAQHPHDHNHQEGTQC